MNIYSEELQQLKPWDQVQGNKFLDNGYLFIYTAQHGYLAVPYSDKHIAKAKDICSYGFVGKHAVYLEEDCEASEFNNNI